MRKPQKQTTQAAATDKGGQCNEKNSYLKYTTKTGVCKP